MTMAFDTPFDGLIAALAPAQRRMLAKEIAFTLRSSQAQRIQKQQNPDGSAYEKRKPQRRVRRKKKNLRMFNRLHKLKFLKRSYDAGNSYIEFGSAVNVARVHQYGLYSNVGPGIRVKYAQRQLLGFSDDDVKAIESTIINHLSKGFS